MILNRKTLYPLIHQALLLSALAISSTGSLAGIYKWVDAEGKVHYGQQRPANETAEKMTVQQYAPQDSSTYKRPGTQSSDDQTGEKLADDAKNQTQDKPPIKPEKKKESKADKKRRLAACAQARSNLSKMESIGRIRSKDKDGNVTYVSQKQKEARMKQARSLISKHCK